jgi:crossover junction endodeoxyribonuclease RuvC
MLVIGIDPGTASTGYGVIREDETGEIKAINFGVIETSPKLSMPRRLQSLFEQLNQIIDLHRPQAAAVEKLFFQKNVKTAISVGQARGVAILALAKADLSVAEYSPLEVKQAVVGYGGADKSQVQQMVRILLNLEDVPKPDDAADALAVAICHAHNNRIQSIVNKP